MCRMIARSLGLAIFLSIGICTSVFAADPAAPYINHLVYYYDFILGTVHQDGATNHIYFMTCEGAIYLNLDLKRVRLTDDPCGKQTNGTPWPSTDAYLPKDISSNAKTWVGVVQNDCNDDNFSILLQDMFGNDQKQNYILAV
jgi:hypothetical protein